MPSVWTLSITRSSSAVGAGAEAVTNQVTAGRLAGLEQGYLAAFETAGKIDDLAHLVTRDLNAVHRKGVTLDGQLGGDLFVAEANRRFWRDECRSGYAPRLMLTI